MPSQISTIKFTLPPITVEPGQQFGPKAKQRDDQGDYWWELRHCAYYPEFEKEKVVWTPVNSEYSFTIPPQGFYFINSIFMVTCTRCEYFCAILNSKLIRHYLSFLFSSEDEYTYASKESTEKVPIPPITPDNEPIVKQIESLVEKIITSKQRNPNADTSQREKEIDRLVYQLYDLTEEEIEIIERGK